MGFNEQDRLRDLERQVSRLQDDTARLPISWPTVDPASGAVIVLATAKGELSDTDTTFPVDNIDLITGIDPRDDPGSATETLTVRNTFGLTLEDNALVFAIKDVGDDHWETWVPGEGAASPLIQFELTEDMDYDDAAKLAKPLQDDGTVDAAADTVYVLDTQQKFLGYGPYTDALNNSTHGFRCWAKLAVPDHASSGKPGYEIVTMDTLAEEIIVRLRADVTSASVSVKPLVVTGNNALKRLPKEDTAADNSFIAYDENDFATDGLKGQQWIARLRNGTEIYVLTQQPSVCSRLRGTIKITSGNLLASDTVYMVEGLVAMEGRLPVDDAGDNLIELVAVNEPPIIGKNGDEVEIIYDQTAGSDELHQWRNAAPLNYVCLKGTVSGSIDESVAFYTLTSISAVEGEVPKVGGSAITSVDVENDPPCQFVNTDPGYAQFNITASANGDEGDRAKCWDSGTARNFLAHLRGIGAIGEVWDSTKDQSIGHDTSGQPGWQEDEECDA